MPTKFFRARQLAKLLSIKPQNLLKDIAINHRNKLYCCFDDVFFEFPSAKDIIIPESFALSYIKKSGRKSKLKIGADTSHFSQSIKSLDKIPVVAILGHFDHGKTTLLDRLGGTNLCVDEVEGITQTVRTQCISLATSASDIDIPNSISGISYDKSIAVLSERHITCVDTPGQDFFYRMRNYGASVADIAVLVVAADSGVCDQTQESIGIAEGLEIPVVVVINKIDLFNDGSSKLKDRLLDLERDIRQFNALNNSLIVPVSAKYGLNMNQLKQAIFQTISLLWHSRQIHWPAFSSLFNYFNIPLQRRFKSELSSYTVDELTEAMGSASGNGTTLNLWKNVRDGTALHVVVNTGYVAAGDYFFSGGWSGSVKRIYLSSPVATVATEHESKAAQELRITASLLPLSHAMPGIGVKLIVELHEKSHEPRPLGEMIAFYSSAKSKRLNAKADDFTRDYVESLADAQRMEHMYFNFALSDALAAQYRLPELWVRMKKAATSGTKTRAVDEEKVLDNEIVDVDDQPLSERHFGEMSGNWNKGNEEKLESLSVINVVLKVDSDIILGTVTDALTDKEDSFAVAAGDDVEAELSLRSSAAQLKLVSSGVGEVIGRDVLIAHAANGYIFTYNVPVQLEAQKQAARQNVKIVRFDLVRDIIALLNDIKSSVASTAVVQGNKKEIGMSSTQAVREYLNQLSLKRLR